MCARWGDDYPSTSTTWRCFDVVLRLEKASSL
ncbi:hypothetical protein DKP78_16750 [Enterococcus faecium]|nr:hypothetical protein DKP78_16750 [Enterococcus faecium]